MNKESQVDVAQETIKMSYLDVLSFPNTPPKKESRTTLPKDDKKTILAFAIFTMVLLALVTIAVFTMMCLPKQKHYQTITKKANVVRGEKKFCSYYLFTYYIYILIYMCRPLVKFILSVLGYYKQTFTNQNMYLIYHDGTILNLGVTQSFLTSDKLAMLIQLCFVTEWTKNATLYVSHERSGTDASHSIYDNDSKCGHFPMYDGHQLNLFLGDKESDGWSYTVALEEKQFLNSSVPRQFNFDASSVRIGDYFWIFGGSHPCSN